MLAVDLEEFTMSETAGDQGAAPTLGDVHDSVAFSLMDDLRRTKKLSEEEYNQYKAFYELLHNRVIQTHERERSLRGN